MAERWAVDASVVAKIYLREEQSDLAAQLIARFAAGVADLIAPQLILYEVPSTILGAVRGSRIDIPTASQAIREFFGLGIPTVGDDETVQDMIRSAYALAAELDCSLYDALYLLVARDFDRTLITADGRLFRGVGGKVDNIVLLADYQPVP